MTRTCQSSCVVLLFNVLCVFHATLAVRGSRPGKNVQLTEGEIKGLCLKSREIFLSQPILLELEAPLKICGECRRPVLITISLLVQSPHPLINMFSQVVCTDSISLICSLSPPPRTYECRTGVDYLYHHPLSCL